MDKKILIVTSTDELNVPFVLKHIPDNRVFRFNTDELLSGSTFFLHSSGRYVEWEFCVNGRTLHGEEVGSIWYRRPQKPVVPSVLPEILHEFVRNETHKALMALWSVARNGIFWMNHPDNSNKLEYNKLLQARIASILGLTVPTTLVTNNPEQAHKFFFDQDGQVIIKAFGGVAPEDEEGELFSVFTNRIREEDLNTFSDDIRHSPVMFQNYIPKAVELRITVVGNKVFACAIHSQDSERTKDDWRRYDPENVKHEVYNLPKDVEEKLLAFMRELGLNFGAIDMIVTPEGDHVFIEVNPSGQWGWIETITGMPICEAIAETLMNPPHYS